MPAAATAGAFSHCCCHCCCCCACGSGAGSREWVAPAATACLPPLAAMLRQCRGGPASCPTARSLTAANGGACCRKRIPCPTTATGSSAAAAAPRALWDLCAIHHLVSCILYAAAAAAAAAAVLQHLQTSVATSLTALLAPLLLPFLALARLFCLAPPPPPPQDETHKAAAAPPTPTPTNGVHLPPTQHARAGIATGAAAGRWGWGGRCGASQQQQWT